MYIHIYIYIYVYIFLKPAPAEACRNLAPCMAPSMLPEEDPRGGVVARCGRPGCPGLQVRIITKTKEVHQQIKKHYTIKQVKKYELTK